MAQKPPDALTPGVLAEDEMRRAGVWQEPSVNGQRPVLPRVMSAREILAWEAPHISTLPFLARQGLIMEGGTNLLYSFPKVGKTELLAALATEWTDQGMRVLYLSEEPYINWKQRLPMCGCDSDLLRVCYAWGYHVHDALEVVTEETFDVVIADTIRNTLGYLEGKGDEDVARVVVPFFAALAGKTVVAGYHARKMPGEGGRDISGHHALFGAFDRAFQLSPVEGRDDQRKVSVSGRCMYEGDLSVVYRQVEPGIFQILDGAAVAEASQRPKKIYELVCLECGDEFEAYRSDAKTCSDECRQRMRRRKARGDAE